MKSTTLPTRQPANSPRAPRTDAPPACRPLLRRDARVQRGRLTVDCGRPAVCRARLAAPRSGKQPLGVRHVTRTRTCPLRATPLLFVRFLRKPGRPLESDGVLGCLQSLRRDACSQESRWQPPAAAPALPSEEGALTHLQRSSSGGGKGSSEKRPYGADINKAHLHLLSFVVWCSSGDSQRNHRNITASDLIVKYCLHRC